MKLSPFRRIIKTDYKQEFQDLVEQLSTSLNNALDGLYGLTTNNISLKDNISCTLKVIEVSVDSTGKPKNPVVIKLSTSGKVQGLTILNTTNTVDSTVYPTSGVSISFSIINSGVSIDNITGLLPNNKYQINVVIFQD